MTKIHFLTEHTSSKAMELLKETLIFNSIFTSMTQVKWRTPSILTRFALFPLMHFHHVSLGQVSLLLKVSKFISFFFFFPPQYCFGSFQRAYYCSKLAAAFKVSIIILPAETCFAANETYLIWWSPDTSLEWKPLPLSIIKSYHSQIQIFLAHFLFKLCHIFTAAQRLVIGYCRWRGRRGHFA